MVADDLEIARVAEAIRRYVRLRPQAADSLRGIAESWLVSFQPPPSFETVRVALELLERDGTMGRARLGGGEIWRAARR